MGSVCIATVVQIASLARGLNAADQTRAMMKPVILQQLVMNLSILTAVILSLHNFIANLTVGGFGVEVRESTNELSNPSHYGKSRQHSGASKAFKRSDPDNHTHSSSHLSRYDQVRVHANRSSLRPDQMNKSNAWAERDELSELEESDRRSEESQEDMIKRTVASRISRDASSSSVARGQGEETPGMPHSGVAREASVRDFLT